MTEINQVYKCAVCGNIVEVVHSGVGQLVCCNQPMQLQTAKNQDQGSEKHVPVSEQSANEVTIKVGSVPHPMDEDHYIEWVELIPEGQVLRQTLKPGAEPKAKFLVPASAGKARAYCNIHGLWTE
jgi:superoxide reductase